MKTFLTAIGIVFLLLAADYTFSQSASGRVTGIVQDPSKTPLSGVTVTLTNTETKVLLTSPTHESGEYDFPVVPLGTYNLRAEMPGFVTVVFNGMQLTSSAPFRISFALRVGAMDTKDQLSVLDRMVVLQAESSWKLHTDNAARAKSEGKVDDWTKEAELAVKAAQSTFGSVDPRYAANLKLLGDAYIAAGRPGDAEQRFRQATLILDPRSIRGGGSVTPSEAVYLDKAKCGDMVNQNEAVLKNLPGWSSPEILRAENTLRLFGLPAPVFPNGSPIPDNQVMTTVGDRLTRIGLCLRTLGKLDEAEAVFSQSFRILTKLTGDSRLAARAVGEQLASLLRHESRYVEAADYYRTVAGIREDVEGTGKSMGDLHALGIVLREAGKYDESDACLLKEVDFSRGLGLADQLWLGDLAQLRIKQGYNVEAEDMGQKDTDRKRGIQEGSHMILAFTDLGEIYVAMKDYASAAEILQQALELAGKSEDAVVGRIIAILGDAYRGLGRNQDAEEMYVRAKAIYERQFGSNSPASAAIVGELGYLRFKQGSRLPAETLLTQALLTTQAAFGTKHPAVARIKWHFAELREDQGKYAEAEQYYKDAIGIMEAAFVVDRPALAPLMANYADFLKARQRATEAAMIEKRARLLAELKEYTPGRTTCVIPTKSAAQ